MYIGVDIGGTKTLIALLNSAGKILKHQKYPTDERFGDFAKDLVHALREDFMTDEVEGIAIAAPGQIDYQSGEGKIFGNLPWHNVPLASVVKEAFNVPVIVENDANAAAIAEARSLDKPASIAVYVTISTGIGTGIVLDGKLDEHFRRSEGGWMHFEHKGEIMIWEKFASGLALYERYGKYARELEDEDAWQEVAYNIALGLSNIATLLTPEVIIIGGSIGQYLPKYQKYLEESMDKLKEKMYDLPRLVQAKHPEEAVVYGCYEMLKDELDG
ncbi:MAG TPA: ROK family protein [Candidatus Saccharimonadales bacterium]|jgi:glucokinase